MHRFVAAALVACAFALQFVPTPAIGHDHWISQGRYTDENGIHCCNEHDIEQLSDDRVRMAPDGYWIDGRIFIPKGKALPSEDGKWWVAWKGGVKGGDPRCFFFAGGSS